MDRQTGKVLWTAQARSGFRHNAICIGGGRLYAIDRLSGAAVVALKRRGESPPHPPRLVVFDLKTGSGAVEHRRPTSSAPGSAIRPSATCWSKPAARRATRFSDEPKGMRAYRASDGKVLWENKSYQRSRHDPPRHDPDGRQRLRPAHRRAEDARASARPASRSSGPGLATTAATRPLASEHLLTFRSGAAGYFDLCNDGGTGNFGGFRSSCTNNLIVAGGVLTAPDYTRTCTCSYQNQTSLALVHMPAVGNVDFVRCANAQAAVRRVGINLGAPGDRKADDGTLWLEYPSVGGSSPR